MGGQGAIAHRSGRLWPRSLWSVDLGLWGACLLLRLECRQGNGFLTAPTLKRSREAWLPPGTRSDELAAITVFEEATRSVAFIVNSTIQLDLFSLNPVEASHGEGGVVWDESGHSVTPFPVGMEWIPSRWFSMNNTSTMPVWSILTPIMILWCCPSWRRKTNYGFRF